jgi:hypothetical protein
MSVRFPIALLCALLALPASHASADQWKKNEQRKTSVIIVNGQTVIVVKGNHMRTKTIKPATRFVSAPAKPAPKGMPAMKGDAASCVTLVRDTTNDYNSPYYRARNACAHRIRLWVFDTGRKQWFDSIILEAGEDATSPSYDGVSAGADQFVAACTMSGDTTPPGCFSKAAGGSYAIATNNVVLH